MKMKANKCKTCIGKYECKTSYPCLYCKWNKEQYFGRDERNMINDNYRYVEEEENSDIPY